MKASAWAVANSGQAAAQLILVRSFHPKAFLLVVAFGSHIGGAKSHVTFSPSIAQATSLSPFP